MNEVITDLTAGPYGGCAYVRVLSYFVDVICPLVYCVVFCVYKLSGRRIWTIVTKGKVDKCNKYTIITRVLYWITDAMQVRSFYSESGDS